MIYPCKPGLVFLIYGPDQYTMVGSGASAVLVRSAHNMIGGSVVDNVKIVCHGEGGKNSHVCPKVPNFSHVLQWRLVFLRDPDDMG